MKARALHFLAPHSVEIREVDVPPSAEGQVLVRTAYSGISAGTEMLAYRGEIDPSLPLDETIGALGGTFAYPFRYGYSAVGVVEEGAGEGSLVFAFHPHQDVFVAAEADLIALGDLDARTATLFPLVETALQVTLDAAPRLSESAVVLGLGAVGLLSGALLVRAGAQVIAADPLVKRREAAAAFGIRAFDPAEMADAVAAATDGRGADVLVEASGSPDALAGALDLLAHEGSAVVCSWYGARTVPLPLGGRFHRRRLAIRSSQVSTLPGSLSSRWDRSRRRRAALRLLTELPVHLIVTHTFPFDAAADAYRAIDAGDEDVIHVALRYG